MPINIEGMSFNVTKNLEDALRHLRDEQFPRMIWIDVHQSSRLTGKKLPSTNHGIYISERISSERMAFSRGGRRAPGHGFPWQLPGCHQLEANIQKLCWLMQTTTLITPLGQIQRQVSGPWSRYHRRHRAVKAGKLCPSV